jgi:hypothetical protein
VLHFQQARSLCQGTPARTEVRAQHRDEQAPRPGSDRFASEYLIAPMWHLTPATVAIIRINCVRRLYLRTNSGRRIAQCRRPMMLSRRAKFLERHDFVRQGSAHLLPREIRAAMRSGWVELCEIPLVRHNPLELNIQQPDPHATAAGGFRGAVAGTTQRYGAETNTKVATKVYWM